MNSLSLVNHIYPLQNSYEVFLSWQRTIILSQPLASQIFKAFSSGGSNPLIKILQIKYAHEILQTY